LNLKKFFLYSSVVHALIIAAMFFIVPVKKDKKSGGEYYAELVSPEEVPSRKPLILPPLPRTRSVPPSRAKPLAPAPSVSRQARTERGASYDRSYKSYGETKDAAASPPSPDFSKGGHPGLSGDDRTGPASLGVQKPERPGPSLKEKLFDKNVIGDLAKRNIEKEDRKEKTFTFDAKDYRFLIYNRRLKERIESIWHYPPEAAARGIYGDLIIRFTIKKNGLLGAVDLVRTSGQKDLDDAAMEALREGAPYWPLPEEWGMEAYTIEGHFIYTIYGYYVR
jgi:protein TonB